MSFFQRRMGGEWGARTPVEQRRYITHDYETEVKIPRAQGFWIAFPFAVACITLLIAPPLIGQRVFQVAMGITAASAFIWSVLFETHWLDRITLPLLNGIVAWCWWAFIDWVGLRVPEGWQPYTAVGAVFLVIFWWTWTAALWLPFWQEVLYRSEFAEMHLFEAFGHLVKLLGERLINRPKQARDPVLLHSHGAQNGGKLQAHELPPEAELTLLEQFLMIAKNRNTLARERMTTAHLASGRRLTKNQWYDCIGRLGEAGYIVKGSRGWDWAPGASADVALQRFSRGNE